MLVLHSTQLSLFRQCLIASTSEHMIGIVEGHLISSAFVPIQLPTKRTTSELYNCLALLARPKQRFEQRPSIQPIMPSTTPTLYFPGSQKRVMVLDHHHRFLTSNDHPLKTDIAHMVFMSENAHQMETLAVNGHRCRLEKLVQRIRAHMIECTDPKKAHLPADKDKSTTPPDDVEEKCVGGKVYDYIPRDQVEALTQDVLFDIEENNRATRVKKMVRRLTNDAVVMASPDPEKGYLPAYNDKAITPPDNGKGKRVGGNQHIYLPRDEADAWMLTQDVLFETQNEHRAVRMKKMERQLRMDAMALLVLKMLLVLDVLALMLMLAWRVAFQVRGD